MEKRYEVPFWQLLVIGLQSDLDITTKPHGGSYIWGNFKINEPVDFDKLKKSINYFIERNDSIRTKFCYEDGKIRQYFSKYEPVDFEIIDVENDEQVEKIKTEMNEKFFDMIEKHMYSIKLYRYPNGHGGVLVKVHHTIADGWSLGLAGYEVINNYIGKFVFPITGSFGDYLDNRNKYETSARLITDKKYWDELLKDGIPEAVSIPQSKPEKETYSWAAEKYKYELDEELINKIRTYCKDHKTSMSKFFMSAYAVLQNKISNSRKFMMNSMSANRRNIKERFTTGMFTAMTYFMVECPNMKFTDFIKKIDSSLTAGYRHRDYLDRHMFELIGKYNPNNQKMFTKLTFSYQCLNMKTDNKSLKYEVSGDNNPSTGGLDMAVHVFDLESSNKLDLIYDYLSDKFDRADAEKFNSQVLDIINQVLTNEDIYIDDISIKDNTLIENNL